MKILHIGKFYPPYRGGMEHYLCDLAKAQVQQGHEVTVWVHNHEYGRLYSATTETQQDGVRLIRQSAWRPILFTPLMRGFGKQLKRLLAEFQPDVLHLHSPNPSLFYLLLRTDALRLPCVLRWHSDMVTEHTSWLMRLVYGLIRPLENRLLKHMDLILISSPNYPQESPQLQRNQHKVRVVPLGLDVQALQSLALNSAQNWWPNVGLRLYHLGRLTYYKDQALLLRAMSQLDAAHLNLAGDGQLAEALSQQVVAQDLSERVSLLGSVSWSDAHALFDSCDVFCLSSNDRAESFGVVLLEAMYHDRIIVVADTPGSGMSWLANQYNKGFVFKAGDVADLVRVVEHIRANLTEIKQRPPQFEYPIEAVAESIQLKYQTLISGEKHE